MTELVEYLATVDAAAPTTLNAFSDGLTAMQRVGNTFAARLMLELAELDAAHTAEAARRLTLDPIERGRGDTARLNEALENATQRTRFLQERWQQVGALLTQLRVGANDLRDDQRVIRALLSKSPTTEPTP